MVDENPAVPAPAVTVLMAAYDAAEYIDEAVASVLGQTFPDFELLVVDDGSADETAQLARSHDDARVRVVSLGENVGAAAARNIGLRAARAELIAILDADDIACPERLARQVAYLRSHPRCGLLGSAYHEIDAAGTIRGTVAPVCEPALIRWMLLTRNVYAHCSVMLRREAALAAGGYDESLRNAEDYALWAAMASSAEPACLPDVLAAHRDNPRGLTATKPALAVPGAVRVVQRALSAAAGRPVSLDAARCLKGGVVDGRARRAACAEAADALADALEGQVARDSRSSTYRAALLTDWREQVERLPERSPAAFLPVFITASRLTRTIGGERALVSRGHLVWSARSLARAVRALWRSLRASARAVTFDPRSPRESGAAAHDRRRYILDPGLQPQEALLLRVFARDEELVIFDAGSCEGENAVRYGRLFPRATVYAVEPLPENVAIMRDTIAEFGAANVTPVEACLADDEAETDFHVSSGSPPPPREADLDWDFGNKSSSLLAPGRTASVHPWLEFARTVRVTTTRLDGLAGRLGVTRIDFLHLDVQGAELMVLNGAGALLRSIHTLWLEVEAVPLYDGQPVKADLEAFLRRHGFVKLLDTVGDVSGDQFWADASWLRARKGPVWAALARLKRWSVIAAIGRRRGLSASTTARGARRRW